ncbi:hypothetical protein D3C80_806510 [compost metagenome]
MLFVAIAADSTCQHQILANPEISLRIRNKTQTGFEDTDTALLTVLIINDSTEQTGQQGKTHRRHFAGDRIRQNQSFVTRMYQLLHLRINEAIGNNFLIAFVVEHGFHTLQRQIGFSVSPHDQTCLHWLIGNIVVAVYTRHFFHQIFFD